MTQYTVVNDYYVQEFDVRLEAGMSFQDGDLEPDVIARLLNYGIIEVAGGFVEPSVEDAEDGE